uniref:Uncharacterized protein n=1 Tax=Fervidobacterium pennivorans TaxID=93466 RepID=A0A7V4NFU1_FERPE
MMHLLGDFYIDELPNCELSKSELIVFSYLIVKKQAWLTELLNILEASDSYDKSYVRKILKILNKKLNGYLKIDLIKRSKITIEHSLNADINIIQSQIEVLNVNKDEFQKVVTQILELYKGDFLPFLDNPWIVSFRNLFRSLVFSVFSKAYFDPNIPVQTKIRLLKILPEFYLSAANSAFFKFIAEGCESSIADSVFDFSEGLTAVKLKVKEPDILNQILSKSKKASLLSDTEIILLVESEVAKEILTVCSVK